MTPPKANLRANATAVLVPLKSSSGDILMPIKTYPTLDQAIVDMNFALGIALTQWQAVELKIYQIFVYLCGRSDKVALDAVFHEMSLETKMKAINELIRVRDTSKLKAWDTVAKEVFKQKRLRDKLAHWTVVAGPGEPDAYTAYLCPPTTDPRAQTVLNNPQNAMNADHLK
jgi:hypothetical protein